MGDETDNTQVQTETDNTTVLTDTNSEADAGKAPADDTNSDAAAPGAPADDTGKVDGDVDKPGEDAGEGNQTSPDTYADFVMPEGVTVDAAMLTEATPIFKELGLTQEQAQKLVSFEAKRVQASSESQVDTFNQLMNDWKEQSANDKEFGGDKFEENIKIAQSAISQFGTPELKQLLEEHGVGNHPEIIRFMVKVGKLTAEDVPGGENLPGGKLPQSKAQERVNILYPTDKKT